jgi:uncharacterized protein
VAAFLTILAAAGSAWADDDFENVTSKVSVTSTGLSHNRFTNEGTTTVTITNTSDQPLAGPILLVLFLPADVEPINETTEFGGGPAWFALSNGGLLAPGASVQFVVTLRYTVGTRVTFTPTVYAFFPPSET